MTPTHDNSRPAFILPSFSENSRAVIQGANRGIGFGFVEQLLDCEKFDTVFATCRAPERAEALQSLREQHPKRLQIIPLDLAQEDTIRHAADFVGSRTERLELLINVAGLLHDDATLWPEKRLADITQANLAKSFQINAIGPVLVAKNFQGLLNHKDRAVLANMSARVGSIADNRLGGWYAYRASKAAQNMLTRTMALEFKRNRSGVICVALHPGTTDTGLSRPFQANVPENQLFTVHYAVRKLLNVIDGLGPEDTGSFFAFDGERIEW